MQLFFTKNITQRLIKLNIAKRTASQPPSTSHIHHLPHHNLLCASNNIIHLPYPQHLIFCLQLFRHTLLYLHLFHKPVQHLIAFLINLMQIFIQLSFKQQLHIISMSELFQILTSHMSILSDIIICSPKTDIISSMFYFLKVIVFPAFASVKLYQFLKMIVQSDSTVYSFSGTYIFFDSNFLKRYSFFYIFH